MFFFPDISLRQCELRPRLQQLLRLFFGISLIKSRKWTTTKNEETTHLYLTYLILAPFSLIQPLPPGAVKWGGWHFRKTRCILSSSSYSFLCIAVIPWYIITFVCTFALFLFFSQNFFFILGIPGIPNPAAFIPFFASFSLPLGAAVATFMAIVAVGWQDEDDDEKDEIIPHNCHWRHWRRQCKFFWPV